MTMVPFDSTAPATNASRASSPMRNNFNALFNGDDRPLRPRAQASPNMTIAVSGCDVESFWRQCWLGADLPLNYAGGNSPAVSAPSSNPRIDLLTIDSAGTLAWTAGAEAASPSPPNCPAGKFPICWVYCRTTMTAIYNFEDAGAHPTHGYIYRDVRPFLKLGGGGGSSLKLLDPPVSVWSWSAATGWTDIDISSYTGTDVSKAALLKVSLDIAGAVNADWAGMKSEARKNGTTDITGIIQASCIKTINYQQHGYAGCDWIIPVDASEILEVTLTTLFGSMASIAFVGILKGYFV